jgi:hypothetical protein
VHWEVGEPTRTAIVSRIDSAVRCGRLGGLGPRSPLSLSTRMFLQRLMMMARKRDCTQSGWVFPHGRFPFFPLRKRRLRVLKRSRASIQRRVASTHFRAALPSPGTTAKKKNREKRASLARKQMKESQERRLPRTSDFHGRESPGQCAELGRKRREKTLSVRETLGLV